MATEIERKFLIKNEQWRGLATGVLYRQGYLSLQPERSVRVRVVGDQGYITIKGKMEGISRLEFEYPIPAEDALTMLATLCHQPLVEKYRYRIDFDNLVWEVDEFIGVNQGLLMAEVELPKDSEQIAFPDWIGQEVTLDPRYHNSSLVTLPYTQW